MKCKECKSEHIKKVSEKDLWADNKCYCNVIRYICKNCGNINIKFIDR